MPLAEAVAPAAPTTAEELAVQAATPSQGARPAAPTTPDLAERILALVRTGTYMSANRIAQALREQGEGVRTQTVFAAVSSMFGDRRLTKINDVIRPGPAAGK